MIYVAGGAAPDFVSDHVYIARRNNSLSSSGRRVAFGFILTVTLGIAAAFVLLFGAWPILPFAGIEMGVLYGAFRYMERHACDYERISIRGDRVEVEVREGARITKVELNRFWARVVCEGKGTRLALRSHGREIEIGRHLCKEERRDMARTLALDLKTNA